MRNTRSARSVTLHALFLSPSLESETCKSCCYHGVSNLGNDVAPSFGAADFSVFIEGSTAASLSTPRICDLAVFRKLLHGNSVCTDANGLKVMQYCGSDVKDDWRPRSSNNSEGGCPMQACPIENFFEYVPASPVPCFCAAPIRIGYRLKSPSISDFPPYTDLFEVYITSALSMDLYQLSIDSFKWEVGPRLRMYLKIFPMFNNRSSTFNESEVKRLDDIFTKWTLARSNLFGPYELLNFTLLGPYSNGMLEYSFVG
ncbi:hypothetical protein GIB67_011173 [Kingdonia uniflora]|uniref:Pherophorin domain-containing protein n=1 Tax=Kingdonia uniflora TaxID=39325 RepID=A0A7J7NCH5_9MAGN|nr:hypothetical protein GIB67_011173 [Kingdonia uniflora]